MRAVISYLDFDLLIRGADGGYRAQVLSSPAGEATTNFSAPFSELELENFLLRVGRPRRGTRRIGSPEMEAVKALGKELYDAVFSGDVRACWRTSLSEAEAQNAGLRLRLRIADAPELNDIPWEYLYNASLNRFLSLSEYTPLIRYLDLPERVRPLAIDTRLEILVVISSPSDYPSLDVQHEWSRLNEALAGLIDRGQVRLERLAEPQLSALQRSLRRGEYHILHFIGHGGFDIGSQDGVLVFCNEAGRGRRVAGEHLGTILHDHRSLRLVVLNACEGSRSSRADPFAGVAQTLVQQGVPAVIAMQFEITDQAALTFAEEFYAATADGYPVDAALAAARKAIFAAGNDTEWGTPVLYLRAPNGQLFSINRDVDALWLAAEEKQRAEAARLAAEEKQRAEAARLAAEEKQRAEAARLAAEEKQRAEAARLAEDVWEADQATGRAMPKAAPVSSLLTPVVQIHDPKDPALKDRANLQLTYSVQLPSADDTLRVEALIDGVKVAAEERRLVDKGDTRAGVLRLEIPRRDSIVSVIAYNDNGASVPASVHVQWTGVATEPKLTLYVLAIGISNYRDARMRLRFAAKDADDFLTLAKAQAGGLYEKVIPYPRYEILRDEDATRAAILDGLEWIMGAVTNTNDVAMVYVSGHGMTTTDQRYRFLPYDYDENRAIATTIRDSDLQYFLTKVGGKTIFFLDTSYSGNVLAGGRVANGIIVFASSTGNQLSLESEEWNNSAFTKAIVEGMRGAAARADLPLISIFDLQGYVSRRVRELTDGRQSPVMAMPTTVEDYWIARRLN